MTTEYLILLAVSVIGFGVLFYRVKSILDSRKKLLDEKNAKFESPYILENRVNLSENFDQSEIQPMHIRLGEEGSFKGRTGLPSDRMILENLNSTQQRNLSSTIQDSVVAGDSFVGSTKIENQIFNDADAIARAAGAVAIDAYRDGLQDRSK